MRLFLYGAEGIYGGTFAGTVWPQEGKDGSLFYVERDIIHGGKTTEVLGEVLHFNAVRFQDLIPFICVC